MSNAFSFIAKLCYFLEVQHNLFCQYDSISSKKRGLKNLLWEVVHTFEIKEVIFKAAVALEQASQEIFHASGIE